MALSRTFRRRAAPQPTQLPPSTQSSSERPDGFAHVPADRMYFDAACQSLRPQPVIDALTDYLRGDSACAGRVQYAAGRRVDEGVARTRRLVLDGLGLSPRRYSCSFTLNTTYGLNLLLHQLPAGRFARVVTTHSEHNAVFLATQSYARRAGIDRVVIERASDGSLVTGDLDLSDALIVVSAMDNVDGILTAGLAELVASVQHRGGAVIVDAAQAAPHAWEQLGRLGADALCFSAHKMYGPALGVVVARNDLLQSLDVTFIGGGQVSRVGIDDADLLDEPHTRLEPGLQAWGEILAFGAALDWFLPRRADIAASERALAARLHAGLTALPNLRVVSPGPSPVMSVLPARVDAHRLAVFLARAGIEVRSGHFCAHHWLGERRELPALVRFSLGAHNTDADVDGALEVLGRMMAGL